MIKSVYLFTNRNTCIFDERGQQITDLQADLGWTRKSDKKERAVLEKIINDKPQVVLAQWRGTSFEISIAEFCSILGHGEWYWREYLFTGGHDAK